MDKYAAKALGERGETARRERRLAEHIPYTRHVDERTLETKNGELVQVLRLAGLAHETADTRFLEQRKNVRNTMLHGAASPRIALWHTIVRRRTARFPEGDQPPGFTRELNDAWRERVTRKRMFVNDLYLAVVRRSWHGAMGIGSQLLQAVSNRIDRNATNNARRRALSELTDTTDQLLGNLRPYGAELLTLKETDNGLQSEPLEYIEQLLSAQRRPVMVPNANIAHYLGQARPFFGSEIIELRKPETSQFGAMLSIKEYRADTAPGMLDALLEMPYEAIITQSFAPLARAKALESLKRQQRVMESSGDDAVSQAREIDEGLDGVASGSYSFGSHHLTVMPLADSEGELKEAISDCNGRLNDVGLIATRESEGIAELSFWAQLPGNFGYIPRPAPISTLNFASFASLHNHPQGAIENNHWGPAITLLETTSESPLYFSWHPPGSDLGNTIVIGPSGTGKTLTMSFLCAQSQRVHPRTVYLDKDRGAEIFIRAMSGTYSVLRPGIPSGWNPFRCEDTRRNRGFLAELLRTIFQARGESITAAEAEQIRKATDNLFELPWEDRRLSNLEAFFPHGDADSLAARLKPWIGHGENAWLFDNEHDELSMGARSMGFDLTDVLDDPVVRAPAMLYLFERTDRVLDGDPTLIVIDEGWKALSDPVFVPRIEDWERTIRKRNGVAIFGSQSASSVVNHPIGSVISEQSPTKIIMPNLEADRGSYIDGLGLTEREFEAVRTMPPESRCFLVKQGLNSAIARLDLSGMDDLIAILSGRESTVQLLDQIRAEVGDDPVHWLPEFRRRRKQQ